MWSRSTDTRSAILGIISVLPDDAIERLLRTAVVGRIACCDHAAGGRPYLVPLAYGYDGSSLYAHSGPGTKIRMMRANPLVTIEVDEATASDRWSSVVAEGTYEELTAQADREQALSVIYPDGVPELGAQTIVFRIRLTAKSGRYEVPG